MKTAAQKALAAEFERRAERFAAAPNGDFALGSDGVMRWIGATVATLVAGDDVLKPRTVILADEQLTGPARDKVAARIDRFVAHHIETVLKPLADLANADALTGMTRGLAFQIVENLGILQRRDVAEEVRGLDQDSRAALRCLGVRFGAYHVFMPMLLKPAPAGLITLLWALKNDGRERAGYGDVVNVLAAGRTSVVVDPAFDPMFYRLAGYRVLGRRAVRIDILERLADLIRPALAWRPGSGARPDGAYDGGRFIVTPAMMSILGRQPRIWKKSSRALAIAVRQWKPLWWRRSLRSLMHSQPRLVARMQPRRLKLKSQPCRRQNLFPRRSWLLNPRPKWKRRRLQPLKLLLLLKHLRAKRKSRSRFFCGVRAVLKAATAIRTRIASARIVETSIVATRIAAIRTAKRVVRHARLRVVKNRMRVAATSALISTSANTTAKASAKVRRASFVVAISASQSAIMSIRATSGRNRSGLFVSTPIRLSPSFWRSRNR